MNKHSWAAVAVWAAAASSGLSPAAFAADVGVSISVSQPGVYGRVDIGQFPHPQVVVQQPVIVLRQPQAVAEPVYMWVPPGHRKKWSRHCGRYNACGVPVYFVQGSWYHAHVDRRHGHPGAGAGRPGKGQGHGAGDHHGKGGGHGGHER